MLALCMSTLVVGCAGGGGEEDNKNGEEEGHTQHSKVTLPTVSNYTIRDAEDTDNGKQEGSRCCFFLCFLDFTCSTSCFGTC